MRKGGKREMKKSLKLDDEHLDHTSRKKERKPWSAGIGWAQPAEPSDAYQHFNVVLGRRSYYIDVLLGSAASRRVLRCVVDRSEGRKIVPTGETVQSVETSAAARQPCVTFTDKRQELLYPCTWLFCTCCCCAMRMKTHLPSPTEYNSNQMNWLFYS